MKETIDFHSLNYYPKYKCLHIQLEFKLFHIIKKQRPNQPVEISRIAVVAIYGFSF
jgi:hypothetical protein